MWGERRERRESKISNFNIFQLITGKKQPQQQNTFPTQSKKVVLVFLPEMVHLCISEGSTTLSRDTMQCKQESTLNVCKTLHVCHLMFIYSQLTEEANWWLWNERGMNLEFFRDKWQTDISLSVIKMSIILFIFLLCGCYCNI